MENRRKLGKIMKKTGENDQWMGDELANCRIPCRNQRAQPVAGSLHFHGVICSCSVLHGILQFATSSPIHWSFSPVFLIIFPSFRLFSTWFYAIFCLFQEPVASSLASTRHKKDRRWMWRRIEAGSLYTPQPLQHKVWKRFIELFPWRLSRRIKTSTPSQLTRLPVASSLHLSLRSRRNRGEIITFIAC